MPLSPLSPPPCWWSPFKAGGVLKKRTRAHLFLPAIFLAFAAWPAAAKTYEAIQGKSRIVYHLHHPFHHVEGVSREFTCTVALDDDTTHAAIAVKVPVLSFNSGNSNRDSHALEILEAFKYPFVEFASDSVRGHANAFRVFGQLTFHGIKRPVDFPIAYTAAGSLIRVTAEFVVKLSDFKVGRPALLFVRTDDDLKIEIDVVAPGP